MTGVQNSILIQNVLAGGGYEDMDCPDDSEGGGGGGRITCWSSVASGDDLVTHCSPCSAVRGVANGGKGKCRT